MTEFILSPKAKREFVEIGRESKERFGNAVAAKYLEGLLSAFQQLAEFPNSAPATPQFGENLRCKIFGRHRIFYIIENELVAIATILHHAQDTDTNLANDR